MKHLIKLRFQNGLNFSDFKRDVFDVNGVSELFNFEEAVHPDFVIFGPYGNDLPPKGNYKRIGYYCENIKPDLSICEYAFGVPREEEVKNSRYTRIQWHGTRPEDLLKPVNYNAKKILSQKTGFCNFLYSHRVPYREEFFKQLSKYKKVDAPGKSMNNMGSIDKSYTGSMWERKRRFLGEYKFTIAFENDVYPGYQTEKLYDAMRADSLPIYCGDPFVGDIFDTSSFINVNDYMDKHWINTKLSKFGLMDFEDIRPQYLNGPVHRIKRKLKSLAREKKYRKPDFSAVIDRIIELDNNPELYLKYLSEPWLKNNVLQTSREKWAGIFNNV
ncbi:hypothetical protein DYU05_16605 [Mucilaginibacter terrenus]|uniref:Fucosyltransferase C-terminal domain-containing protein n=1 Tax=Mucilaginibacter terrenus TaxID=2482727 RepID=A0A3E2NML3_9SPHI|nr:glycosyltransferase family 10 [Mucilaginibacter terrenus]RFZ82235.1 hypothetical protein DYU05_16605 [Mucilaginibacter terrenus]